MQREVHALSPNITPESLPGYLQGLRERLTDAILSSKAPKSMISILTLLTKQVNFGDFLSKVEQKVHVSDSLKQAGRDNRPVSGDKVDSKAVERVTKSLVDSMERMSIDQVRMLAPNIENLFALKGIAVLSFRTQAQSVFNDVLTATLSLSEEGLDVQQANLLEEIAGMAKRSTDRNENENGSFNKPLTVDDVLYDYVKNKCRRAEGGRGRDIPSITLSNPHNVPNKLVLYVIRSGDISSYECMEVKRGDEISFSSTFAEARTVTVDELTAGAPQMSMLRQLWARLTSGRSGKRK